MTPYFFVEILGELCSSDLSAVYCWLPYARYESLFGACPIICTPRQTCIGLSTTSVIPNKCRSLKNCISSFRVYFWQLISLTIRRSILTACLIGALLVGGKVSFSSPYTPPKDAKLITSCPSLFPSLKIINISWNSIPCHVIHFTFTSTYARYDSNVALVKCNVFSLSLL